MIYTLIHFINTILLICNLLAVHRINRRLRLPRVNPIREFQEESSEEVAVRFLGISGLATLNMIFMLLFCLTQSRIFIRIFWVIAVIHLIGILAEILPEMQHLLQSSDQIEKVPKVMLGQLALSQFVHLLLMVVIGERVIFDWGWAVVADRDGHIILQCVLLGLVIAGVCFMLYSLVMSGYCLIGCRYYQHDIDREERRQYQDALWELEQDREKLRKRTTEVNRTAERSGPLALFRLGIHYIWYMTLSYIRENWYAMQSLIHAVRIMIAERLCGMLEAERFRNFSRRSMAVIVTAVLLAADLVLGSFYGAESYVTRFYEMISTIVMIPVILAKITGS